MCFLGLKQQMLKIWKLWPIYIQHLFTGTVYLSEVQVSNPKLYYFISGRILIFAMELLIYTYSVQGQIHNT